MVSTKSYTRFDKNLHDYKCLGLSNEVNGGVLDESTWQLRMRFKDTLSCVDDPNNKVQTQTKSMGNNTK